MQVPPDYADQSLWDYIDRSITVRRGGNPRAGDCNPLTVRRMPALPCELKSGEPCVRWRREGITLIGILIVGLTKTVATFHEGKKNMRCVAHGTAQSL